jgi:general stress protein 26
VPADGLFINRYKKMNTEARDKFKEKVKKVKFAMLTTIEEDGEIHTRPIATNEMEEDGSLWFFTKAHSAKVEEVKQDQRVGLSYSDPDGDTYVTASGTASVVRNRKKIEELWNPTLKAWFPKGLEDPDIALLKVMPDRAEYWDEAGGKLVTLFKIAGALLQGKKHRSSEHEKLDLK